MNDVMETKVFSTLDKINNFYLFDHEEAFSRSWVGVNQMNRLMRKLTFCIYENKDADQLVSSFVFRCSDSTISPLTKISRF